MQVLLHVSDWNYVDKYYELPQLQLAEFRNQIKSRTMEDAWAWFVALVDYSHDSNQPDLPIKRCDHRVDHTLDTYFLDYLNPLESCDEWEDLPPTHLADTDE